MNGPIEQYPGLSLATPWDLEWQLHWARRRGQTALEGWFVLGLGGEYSGTNLTIEDTDAFGLAQAALVLRWAWSQGRRVYLVSEGDDGVLAAVLALSRLMEAGWKVTSSLLGIDIEPHLMLLDEADEILHR